MLCRPAFSAATQFSFRSSTKTECFGTLSSTTFQNPAWGVATLGEDADQVEHDPTFRIRAHRMTNLSRSQRWMYASSSTSNASASRVIGGRKPGRRPPCWGNGMSEGHGYLQMLAGFAPKHAGAVDQTASQRTRSTGSVSFPGKSLRQGRLAVPGPF